MANKENQDPTERVVNRGVFFHVVDGEVAEEPFEVPGEQAMEVEEPEFQFVNTAESDESGGVWLDEEELVDEEEGDEKSESDKDEDSCEDEESLSSSSSDGEDGGHTSTNITHGRHSQVVELDNYSVPPPDLPISDLEKEACNFKPNSLQEAPNKYVSVAFDKDIETEKEYDWCLGKDGIPKREAIDTMSTVRAIAEFRELARFMRIPPRHFLDSYYRTAYSSLHKMRTIPLDAEDFNAYSTKVRMNRAHVFITRVDANVQEELFNMNIHPYEHSRDKWHRLFDMMEWPQPRKFSCLPGQQPTYRNFFDSLPNEFNICIFRIHYEQTVDNQFLSVPVIGDRRTFTWSVGKWEVPKRFKTDYLKTVTMVSEIREYARFHRIDPKLMFKDYYQTNCEAMEGDEVSPKQFNWLASKLRATRAHVSIPYFHGALQEQIYNLDLVPTERSDRKWMKFYEIFNWDFPMNGKFPKVKGEREVSTLVSMDSDDDIIMVE